MTHRKDAKNAEKRYVFISDERAEIKTLTVFSFFKVIGS